MFLIKIDTLGSSLGGVFGPALVQAGSINNFGSISGSDLLPNLAAPPLCLFLPWIRPFANFGSGSEKKAKPEAPAPKPYKNFEKVPVWCLLVKEI